MPHTVTVKCAAMPDPPLEFVKIVGGEKLSEPYCYTVTLNTPGDPNIPRQVAANVDYKQMIGKEFTVEIELGDLSRREISGLVTNARILDSGRQQSQYEVTIEPWLVLATRTSDYKRFQDKTVVQILDEVLADYPFPVEKRLIEKYSPLEFQVQYGETDFDFIQRLMQEWGIYWFFEHSGGKHRLILIDNMGAHKPPPSADYHSLVYDTDGGVGKEHLSAFNAIQNHRPGQWVTDDFDFKKPRKKLQITDVKPRQTAFSNQEMYLWPGDYVERDVGKFLAEVRMQAAGVPGSLGFGSGNLPGVPCGCTCSVEDYPADKANREYLIVMSMLDLTEIGKTSGQGEYRCDTAFEFLPTNTVYRPKQTLDKPRTTGPQTAIVVGPPGEEIYTDEYGRIKVQFHWDRYGNNDQDSSCWVRVSYPWAGTNFGGIQLPRIGQEVIVDFENGDPDRPIVTGRVYNGLNMPPWKLPDNATQSGFLTRSSKEGGPSNANAIRFEDKKGEEEVWLHAEKDQCIEVEHDESHWVGNDRSKTIDGNETTIVHKNRTETVDMDEVITIHQNRQKTIDINESDQIGNNWTINVDNNKKETVGMNYMENTGVSKMMNIGMAYSRNVGMAMNSLVGVIQASEVGLTKKLLVGQDYSANIGKTVKLDVGEKKTETVGKVSIHSVGDHLELVCGKAKIVLTSSGGIYLKGEHIELQAQSALNGDADMIQWNCEATQAPPPAPGSKDEETENMDAAAVEDNAGLDGVASSLYAAASKTGMGDGSASGIMGALGGALSGGGGSGGGMLGGMLGGVAAAAGAAMGGGGLAGALGQAIGGASSALGGGVPGFAGGTIGGGLGGLGGGLSGGLGGALGGVPGIAGGTFGGGLGGALGGAMGGGGPLSAASGAMGIIASSQAPSDAGLLLGGLISAVGVASKLGVGGDVLKVASQVLDKAGPHIGAEKPPPRKTPEDILKEPINFRA